MKKQTKPVQTFDVLVLGAGIVGVSTAIYLRRFGLDVALIDRKHPGEEASFGNAGIIQRNGFVPPSMSPGLGTLLSTALGHSTAVQYSLPALIGLLPWLRRYFRASSGAAAEAYCRAVAPLRALAVETHLELASSTNADRYYRRGGWLHLYRSGNSYRASEAERYYARIYGVSYDELSPGDLGLLEPGLKLKDLPTIHWPETRSVSNPGAVVDAFWRGFIQDGGAYFRADALKVQQQRGGWAVAGERASVFGRHAVVALGAWSTDFLKMQGETYPLAAKRGYHMHYRPKSGASLSRPVVDIDNGFVLTPTDNGIRLTTGVELASRDAPANPAIIKHVKRKAEELFPLGRALQDAPWMGSRPCLPDSLPIVGASQKTRGLWFNFGHGHDGFTLGPVTGKLLAELITNKPSSADLAPFSPLRFFS
ncbi:FAD-binding oxidoreductase [Roseibium denhamense]|uniref:D-amino-acid dehydrogenase n=1 Tax=Roseibium denhamense TaxID=76305 RepID=A0ABY1N6N0_9HYPH|nr:FAD-binding oxidoreductase [Roseibium denhamense]MTI06035.1 FAD-binding oxidoreductase [Roseibium denhamense]SMP01867.1 D-amino-acid dehydrogenase [Roseibium denhamense]